MKKFCGKCGSPLSNTDKFCTICGAANPSFVAGDIIFISDADELEALRKEKERIERELEQKILLEKQKAEAAALEQQRVLKEKEEKDRLEKERIEEERKKAEQLSKEADRLRREQEEQKENGRLAAEQGTLLQKIKLERELLQKDIEQIASLKKQNDRQDIPLTAESKKEKRKGKFWVGLLQVVLFIAILAALSVGGYWAYLKFIIPDPYREAQSAINKRVWGAATEFLKQTLADIDNGKSKLQLSAADIERIRLWQPATSQLSVATYYANGILSTEKASVNDYVNIINKFKAVPFDELSKNGFGNVSPVAILKPVTLFIDSIQLDLLNALLQDQKHLSIINESLIYSDGSRQLNFDTIEASINNTADPALSAWYNELLQRKGKLITELATHATNKGSIEKKLIQNAAKTQSEAKKYSAQENPAPVTDLMLEQKLTGKMFGNCKFILSTISQIGFFKRLATEKLASGNYKYHIKFQLKIGEENYLVEGIIIYTPSAGRYEIDSNGFSCDIT